MVDYPCDWICNREHCSCCDYSMKHIHGTCVTNQCMNGPAHDCLEFFVTCFHGPALGRSTLTGFADCHVYDVHNSFTPGGTSASGPITMQC